MWGSNRQDKTPQRSRAACVNYLAEPSDLLANFALWRNQRDVGKPLRRTTAAVGTNGMSKHTEMTLLWRAKFGGGPNAVEPGLGAGIVKLGSRSATHTNAAEDFPSDLDRQATPKDQDVGIHIPERL